MSPIFLRALVAWILLVGATTAQAADDVRIIRSVHVAGVAGTRAEPQWFRFGCPIDESTNLIDPSTLSIEGPDHRPFPATIIATSRWGGAPDDRKKPVKWLLVTTAAPIANGTILDIVEKKPKRGDLRLIRDADDTRIVTPELALTAHAGGPDIVTSLRAFEKSIAARPFGRVVAVDETGVAVEAAPWRIESRFTDASATVTAKTSIFDLEVVVRLDLAVGASEIAGECTIVNRGAYGHMESESEHRYFRRLGITLPTPMHTNSVAIGGQRDALLLENGPVALLTQHTWSAKKALPSERMPFQILQGARSITSGERLTGAIASASEGVTLGIGIERFWQCAPKALAVSAEETILDIFPEGGHGPEFGGQYGEPSKPKNVDPRALSAWRFEGGRAFTTRFRLVLSRRDARDVAADLQRTIDHPLSACPVSMDYGPRGPLGYPTTPVTAWRSEGGRRFERTMRTLVDDREADDQPALGRIGLPAFIERGGTYGQEAFYGWFNYGDIAWGDGYCSLHYDFPFGVLLEFLRTGDPRFFERGDIMAQHRRDIDQDHGTFTKHHMRGGQFYEKGYWHGNYYFPTPSHTWLGGPTLHYLLTGDEGSLEAANLGRDFLLRQHLERWDGLYGVRIPGWTADNLLGLWWIFGRESDLDAAESIIRRFQEIETSKYGAKGYVMNEAMKPVSEQPWMLNIMFNPIARHALLTRKTEFRPLIDRMLRLFRTRCLKINHGRPTTVYRQISPDGATEPAIHLAWPMAASLSLGALVTDDKKVAEDARNLFEGVALYPQEWTEKGPSAIAFRMMNYPNAESKIVSNIALWGPLCLPILERP